MKMVIKGRSAMKGKFKIPILIPIILLIVIGFYCWSIIGKYNKGIPPAEDEVRQLGPGAEERRNRSPENRTFDRREERSRPSPEEIQQRMNEALTRLDLTEQQKQQLENLPVPSSPEQFRQRREELEKILTPEQMERFRRTRGARRDQRMREMMSRLSPQDQHALQERFEQRQAQRGERDGGERREGPPPPPF